MAVLRHPLRVTHSVSFPCPTPFAHRAVIPKRGECAMPVGANGSQWKLVGVIDDGRFGEKSGRWCREQRSVVSQNQPRLQYNQYDICYGHRQTRKQRIQ